MSTLALTTMILAAGVAFIAGLANLITSGRTVIDVVADVVAFIKKNADSSYGKSCVREI